MATSLENLGATLNILRRRARMTQRELSAESKISYTQIGDLEKGRGGHPSPLTLRALARGLSTDSIDETVDQVRADAAYRQLMAAAGYLTGIYGPEAADPTSERGVIAFLAARFGDEDLAERLVRLATRYPGFPADLQGVVRYLVAEWTHDADPT
jgi:transcriptional regulator with XRE-family HTH domain